MRRKMLIGKCHVGSSPYLGHYGKTIRLGSFDTKVVSLLLHDSRLAIAPAIVETVNGNRVGPAFDQYKGRSQQGQGRGK